MQGGEKPQTDHEGVSPALAMLLGKIQAYHIALTGAFDILRTARNRQTDMVVIFKVERNMFGPAPQLQKHFSARCVPRSPRGGEGSAGLGRGKTLPSLCSL